MTKLTTENLRPATALPSYLRQQSDPPERRAGLDRNDLLPGPDLEPLPEPAGAWRATAPEVRFVAARSLPEGWIRVRLRLKRLDKKHALRQHAELRADYGDGFRDDGRLERFAWNEALTDEAYLYLEHPARGLRFDLFEAEGDFAVEAFEAQPVSRATVFLRACGSKIRLVWAYQCLGRTLSRGLWMLATGRFGELRQKLLKGLTDSRRLNWQASQARESFAAWWRRHDLYSGANRADVLPDDLASLPPLTIVLPLIDGPESHLRLAIEAVRQQVYPDWRLVIAANLSASHLKMQVGEYAGDQRVRVLFSNPKIGPHGAATEALRSVATDHVVVLPANAELADLALIRLARELRQRPDADLIASRETERPCAVKFLVDGRTDNLDPQLADAKAAVATTGLCLYRTTTAQALGVPPPADEESHIEWQAAFCARGGQATTIDEVLAHPIGGLSVLGPSFGLMNTGDSVQPSGPPLSVKGHVVGLSGYDHLVFELIRGLGSLGIDLRVSPESQLKQGLVPPYFELLRRKRPEHVPELIIAPPPLLKGFNVHARSVVFTMWECDTIDPAWVRILNRAALIVVPSQWNAGRFRECGVTIPIEVVPLGHDPLVYHADDSFPTICTFGTAAALNAGGVRKNTQRLVELFHQAFPNETDVRLKVKITPSSRLQDCDDPRVEVIRTVLPPAELAAWYRSLSVFVSNSSGEGFGLHLIEAMACARAVIAPAYSGVTEYFDDTVGFVVPHHEIEARQWPYRGHWAEAEDEHLVAAMRRVYADMAWTRELGARSAARARRFTWKAAGQRLRTILSERGVLA